MSVYTALLKTPSHATMKLRVCSLGSDESIQRVLVFSFHGNLGEHIKSDPKFVWQNDLISESALRRVFRRCEGIHYSSGNARYHHELDPHRE